MTEIVTIAKDGLSAEIVTAGAAVRAVHLVGHDHSLVVGAADLEHYSAGNREYLGGTIGRFANRIAAGRFTLEGRPHELACNDGPNHLHGGPGGFSTRPWSIVDRGPDAVTLALVSADGDEGYPGEIRVTARFAILPDCTLSVTYEATTDRPTLVNLTTHFYFNLDGSDDIRGHRLTLASDRYLPIDVDALPTGSVDPVEGTAFDFRAGKPVGEAPDPLDHNFCLGSAPSPEPRFCARLEAETSGIALTVSTTEPGLQVYDGAKLDGSIVGHGGRPIVSRSALALEPQGWPDSPNRPDFPQVRLQPGDTYRHHSLYRFSGG
ncbi:aldose epimerase family protein [Aurantimonas sp. A2-1-M11]|uniref:aldose epimerase family protein n=1 Tax=Aurantimonas sp. A2-1-M11 TaxID=3113712 RepID=UPI002F92FE93